jgi:cell division protein FtsN
MIYILLALTALSLITLVGLFFFFPKEQPKAVATTTPAAAPTGTGAPLPDEFDPVEWTRNPQATPLQTTPTAPTTPGTGDQSFTVTLPPETKPATQNLPPSPGATFPGDATVVKPSAVQSTPVNSTPAAPKAAPVAKAAPKPVVKTKVTEFWIQVASFKDRYQADNTAKALETQGLKGTLTTATVNGVAVVRVRVGPYTNEAEAAKFLSWLKPVKEFEASYITKVSATRTR